MIRICEINIGNPKYTTFTKLVPVRNFYSPFLSLKVFRHEERETQSFYADCFYIVSSQPNQRAAPVAHQFVWLRPGLNLNSLVRRQELNSLLFLESHPTLPVRDVTYIPGSQFLSGIFILISVNDTSSPRARKQLRSCLHLTNPCTEPKGSHPN